ncbi:MAG TPA: hypothetical protein VLW85_15540 [Myxococcales bacterium]|nr:hypothetical protein [Myxococcales bacterium]
MAAKKVKEQKGEPVSPLARAKWSLEVGDVRRARALAREAAQAGPEADRAEAERLLARLRPDPAAMLTVAAVLVLIAIAAWLAILRHHS